MRSAVRVCPRALFSRRITSDFPELMHPTGAEAALQLHHLIFSKNDVGMQIPLVDLLHEFPASPAGRDDPASFRNGNNPLDSLLPVRHHRRDGAVLRAEPHPAKSVDANAKVHIAFARGQCAPDIPDDETVPDLPWPYDRRCFFDQLFISDLGHALLIEFPAFNNLPFLKLE